jgi:C4-dicarboxylate-specific signal transduction histidine kinase
MASSFVHEINQSLTAVRLNAEFLLAVADKPPNNLSFKTNLNYLIKDVDKISEIIENVKRVFHNNELDFKDVYIASVVEAAIALVKDECEKKAIEITVNVDPHFIILGNPSQLEMVVLNLTNNAIDSLSTYEGKRTLAFSATQIGSKILLAIEDSGAGVPLELDDKIFELFRTTKNEGMGFGLWLSRAVMDNHRGSLTLDKDYSDGARFVIEFRTDECL